MPDQNDDPLVPLQSGEMFIAQIIDLAGIRLAAGRNPKPSDKKCQHKSMVYCEQERRVWCEDCNRTIDSFDALLSIARKFDKMLSEARENKRQAYEAKTAVIIRRAAKEIDRTLGSKMAPCCPHCHRGLLPHDFAGGASSAVGIEYEQARRRRDLGGA